MSLNLHVRLDGEYLDLPQIGTDDTEWILFGDKGDDGSSIDHQAVMKRLGEFFAGWARGIVEHEARRKGVKGDPFKGREKNWWNRQLQEQMEDFDMRYLSRIRNAKGVTWEMW